MTENAGRKLSWRPELSVWMALLALLGLTLVTAYAPHGRFGLVANMAIASVQAVLVAGFFMGLRHAKALVRLTACASLFWLAVMFALTLADVLTRSQ
jgi:cytochrome c oxidase subunit 4